MSLRAFHIFFILVSIAFFAGFGVREIRFHEQNGQSVDLLMAIGSFVLGAAASVYLVWFVKRKRIASR